MSRMINTLDRAQKAAQQRNWATLTACLRQLVPPESSPAHGHPTGTEPQAMPAPLPLDQSMRSQQGNPELTPVEDRHATHHHPAESDRGNGTGHGPSVGTPDLAELNHHTATITALALDLAMEGLIEGDFQSRWDLAKVIPKFGTAAIAPLLDLLNDTDLEWETRWFAARILGEIRHPAVLADLVTILQTHPEPELQAVATAALANYGDAAIAALTSALQQPETELMAVQALAQIGTPAVLPGLLTASQSDQVACREVAIAALSHLHDDAIAPRLLQATQDPAAPVRQAAMQGLSHRPDWLAQVDSLAALTDRLWDLNLKVCQAAALALGRLGRHHDGAAMAPVVATLERVLLSPQTPEPLQLSVVQALGWIETPAALTALTLAVSQVETPVQVAIATALGQVSPAQQAAASAQLCQLLAHGVIGRDPYIQIFRNPPRSTDVESIVAVQSLWTGWY